MINDGQPSVLSISKTYPLHKQKLYLKKKKQKNRNSIIIKE